MVRASTKILTNVSSALRRTSIREVTPSRLAWRRDCKPCNFPQQVRRYQLESKPRIFNGDNRYKIAGGLLLAGGLAQLGLGDSEDIFHHKFTVKADPDDLTDFFGTEAAMEAFSIFPFVTNFLMRRGKWDDEGTYRVPIILGEYLSARIEFEEGEEDFGKKSNEELWEDFMKMSTKPGEGDDDEGEDEELEDIEDDHENKDEAKEANAPENKAEVSRAISIKENQDIDQVESESTAADDDGDEDEDEDEDEEEEDEDEDSGNNDGLKCEHFAKKETFRLVEKHIQKAFFHYELEMGFNLLPSGDCEIYYTGLKFRGLFVFRVIFELHALYYMWAMKRYFHSDSFAYLDELTEEAEQYRSNIPVAVIKEYLHDLIKDVEHARQIAKAKDLSTEEHERSINDIKEILNRAGYIGAEAFLVDADDTNGKQKILLELSDKKSMATIHRALTLHSKRNTSERAKESVPAGVTLARKITRRIQEEIKGGQNLSLYDKKEIN